MFVADCWLLLLFVSKHPYLAPSCWHFLLLFLASVSECFLLNLRAVFRLALFCSPNNNIFFKILAGIVEVPSLGPVRNHFVVPLMSLLFLISDDVITENHGFLKQCIFSFSSGAAPAVQVFHDFGSSMMLHLLYKYFMILVYLSCYTCCTCISVFWFISGATPAVHVFQYFGSSLVLHLLYMYFSILVHLCC